MEEHWSDHQSVWLSRYAEILYIDILYLYAIVSPCITLLMKFRSWSVIHAFDVVYGLINFSTSALAIFADVACFSGTVAKYLVSKSCIAGIYKCPLSVVSLWGAIPQYSLIFYHIRENHGLLRGVVFSTGNFGIPVYTFVLVLYLTRNNYNGFFYKILLRPMISYRAWYRVETWFSAIIWILSDILYMVTQLLHMIILVEES